MIEDGSSIRSNTDKGISMADQTSSGTETAIMQGKQDPS